MNSRSPKYQSGVALLAALILMLAVVVILGNIFYRHQIDITQATASMHGDQALLLAMSGEGWARQLLSDKEDDRGVDSFEDDWAQALPMLPVDGGLITGCISDLQGRVNLNSFFGYTDQSLQNEINSENMGIAKLWLQLLTDLQLPADLSRTARIIDWLDADSSLINSWGAEQPDYDGLAVPRVPANTMVTDITELAAVMGYEVAEVQLLAPWLSALPRSTSININTASEQLLMAMSGTMGADFVSLVMEERPFDSINEFYRTIVQNMQLEMPVVEQRWPTSLLSVKSDYFELYLEVILGEARIEVKSIMDRTGRDEPVIIARQLTVVPASLPKADTSAVEKLFDSITDTDITQDTDFDESAETNQVQSACLMIGENN
jgi:general secretion pathway protein K